MQLVVDCFEDPAMAMRLENGLLVVDGWNRACEQMSYRGAEDVIDRTPEHAMPSLNSAVRARRQAQLLDGHWWSGRSGAVNGRGESMLIDSTVTRVVDDAGEERWLALLHPVLPTVPQQASVRRILSQIAGSSWLTGVTLDSSWGPIPGLGSDAVSSVVGVCDDVGARIRARRESRNLTKRGLAKLAGVNESQLGQWERGDHVPTITNMLRLIEHLGGTLDDYLAPKDRHKKHRR